MAFSNPQGLDILQIVDDGMKVVWSLSALGVATNNPTNPTPNAILGKLYGSSFTTSFTNPYNLNILQVKTSGGKVVFAIDYLGNASTF